MRSLFKLGGYFASGILIVLGAGTVVVGALDPSEHAVDGREPPGVDAPLQLPVLQPISG